LGTLPGFTDSSSTGINDAGQAVGSSGNGGVFVATEWTGGHVIDLGGLPGFTTSTATGNNDTGQAVGVSFGAIPEPSTWAMMLLGFAGLWFLGYRTRRAKPQAA
jgi:uncharacterized membrane protein